MTKSQLYQVYHVSFSTAIIQYVPICHLHKENDFHCGNQYYVIHGLRSITRYVDSVIGNN